MNNINYSKNWIIYTKNILDNNGLSYIFLDYVKSKPSSEQNIERLVKIFDGRNKDIFKQTIMHHIHKCSENNTGKLSFYGTQKEIFHKELYLNIKNSKNRKVISEFRLSAHKLEIESGRYEHKNREERKCKCCNLGAIEDEQHFILDCPAYLIYRNSFFQQVWQELGIDLRSCGINGIKVLFLQNNLCIMNDFAILLKSCWEKRNSLLLS